MYTALGERRRLETLARTGTSVRPTSALANRQAQARTGNVVRVNFVNRNTTSKPLSRPVTTSTEEQVQDYARRVIRGEFGNGQERKDKLGNKYAQVQALVNAMLLKGRKK